VPWRLRGHLPESQEWKRKAELLSCDSDCFSFRDSDCWRFVGMFAICYSASIARYSQNMRCILKSLRAITFDLNQAVASNCQNIRVLGEISWFSFGLGQHMLLHSTFHALCWNKTWHVCLINRLEDLKQGLKTATSHDVCISTSERRNVFWRQMKWILLEWLSGSRRVWTVCSMTMTLKLSSVVIPLHMENWI